MCKRGILAFGVLAFGLTQAAAWGEKGHRLVADIAWASLRPSARAKVQDILGPGVTLASLADDADELRDRTRENYFGHPHLYAHRPTEDRIFFEDERNKTNPSWHFCNLPLGTTAYTPTAYGASSTDVVHTISMCQQALRGETPRLTNFNALRLLVHFVGDIHQPLHTACGYFKPAQKNQVRLLRTPTEINAAGGKHDTGGNIISVGGTTLHSFWDSKMVDAVVTANGGASQVVGRLITKYRSAEPWSSVPEGWVGGIVDRSDRIYQGLYLRSMRRIPNSGKWQIYATMKPSYIGDHLNDAERSIAYAGMRLAAFLNHTYAPNG